MIKSFFIGLLLFFSFVHRDRGSSFIIDQVSGTKDTLIDVGDHKLHFVITKKGEPTILLESGGGADASQWEGIQQKLANETNVTVISYDRAGYGKSELPNTSYSLKTDVQDLHKCLKTLGINKIVLVGHSYGAFLSQAYQFMYPENVRAIILADPNNVTFVDSIGIRILMQIPFDTTKPLSIIQKADVRQTIALPNTIETLREMPYSNDIPITIISAGKDWWPFPKWNKWWKNSHQLIVNASKKGILIKAEGSAHNIPKERPDIIVNAIMETIKK
jgi:pimeloyl-ACP methyl ester carboxylesterase